MSKRSSWERKAPVPRLLNAHLRPIMGPTSFILYAVRRTIKSTPRFTKAPGWLGAAWFMQGNSRKHTQNASGPQCIPVCILNLGYLPAPDQISSVIVARSARSHAHNLSTRSSANLGLNRRTCENRRRIFRDRVNFPLNPAFGKRVFRNLARPRIARRVEQDEMAK
jgi:hypothetical protein